jgi:hypothetical protein
MANMQITKTTPHSLCDRQARQARSEALAQIFKTIARQAGGDMPARQNDYTA